MELKAISEVDKNCYNQVINYLKVFNLEVGLLLNFGAKASNSKGLPTQGRIREILSKSQNL